MTTEERIMLGFQIECQQHYRWDNSTYMKIVIQGMKLYYRPERNNKQQLWPLTPVDNGQPGSPISVVALSSTDMFRQQEQNWIANTLRYCKIVLTQWESWWSWWSCQILTANLTLNHPVYLKALMVYWLEGQNCNWIDSQDGIGGQSPGYFWWGLSLISSCRWRTDIAEGVMSPHAIYHQWLSWFHPSRFIATVLQGKSKFFWFWACL